MQRMTNTILLLRSAAHGTGLYANIPSVLTFSPLKTLASAHLVASVRDAAARLIHAPTTPPLARKQYAIGREWLAADDVASIEVMMFPGGSTAPSDSEFIGIYSVLMVRRRARYLHAMLMLLT